MRNVTGLPRQEVQISPLLSSRGSIFFQCLSLKRRRLNKVTTRGAHRELNHLDRRRAFEFNSSSSGLVLVIRLVNSWLVDQLNVQTRSMKFFNHRLRPKLGSPYSLLKRENRTDLNSIRNERRRNIKIPLATDGHCRIKSKFDPARRVHSKIITCTHERVLEIVSDIVSAYQYSIKEAGQEK